MITTPNMSLIAWDLTTDAYNHTQLANNWVAVDGHDHSPGKGKQVPGSGLADGSITSAKLAVGAVQGVNIANATIDSTKMAPGTLVPVGTVIPWYRPNTSTSIPIGWVIPTGQNLTAANHDFGGGGTIALPDLRNKFILGADTSGTGSGTGTPPGIGQAGGSHTANLSHSHSVNAHTHTVSHGHSVAAHDHPISLDGDHSHGFYNPGFGTGWTALKQRTTAVPSAVGTRQSLYVPGLNQGGSVDSEVDAPMEPKGAHAHGWITGQRSTSTSVDNPSTSSNGTATDSQLDSSQDIRPAYVGLLYLMKVKN